MFMPLVYLLAWFGANALSILIVYICLNGTIDARRDISLIILVGFISLPVWYLLVTPVAHFVYNFKRRK